MTYSPLNIQNKNLLKSDWLIKQQTEYSWIINSNIKEEYLRSFVPEHFQIDRYQNSPMLSVVIIKNKSLAFKYLPFIKNKNSFQIYLRTYVKRGDIPGYFYLNIDTNHKKLNQILKTLTDLPFCDSSIKEINDSKNIQIDSISKSSTLYANLQKENQREMLETNPELKWMQNRFNIYNIQKSQVINWKIDSAPDRIFKANIINFQLTHANIPTDTLEFEKSGYFVEGNLTRIWPPSLL